MKKTVILIIASILFTVFLSPYTTEALDENSSDLSIICPSQVNESYPFVITIKSNNISIDNVTVIFNGGENLTNSAGRVIFYAPRVLPDENNTYNITASKEGHNSTTISITVANVPQLFPTVISSTIDEGTDFVVTVSDDEGRLVDNATIIFNDKSYKTDINGTITLTAPSLNRTEEYTINATKPGYIDNSILIRIIPGPSQENLLGFYISVLILIFIAILVVVLLIMKHLKRRRINQ